MYDGKTVLITGGTGSFGMTMARHLVDSGCSEVRIFSRDEAKQDSMRHEFDHSPLLRFYIGDVRDRDSVDHVMRGVDFVFHAAALKQVPSCEFFPIQAVMTNIMGSHNVAESAITHEVERVVFLSTDKAVYPINAMGMTKALMEKVAQAATRHIHASSTTIACVRYGNVMYSRGSVIPRFVKQIAEGKPLTVTDPTMTRFLMPLRDSVALVERAFVHARQGDLFVKKAPACTIGDLAATMLELFESDVSVREIGIRHGEKTFETLAWKEELSRAEDADGYFRIPMDDRDLNYDHFFDVGSRIAGQYEDYHSENAERLDREGIRQLLLSLPEIQRDLAIEGRTRS